MHLNIDLFPEFIQRETFDVNDQKKPTSALNAVTTKKYNEWKFRVHENGIFWGNIVHNRITNPFV